MRVKAVHVTNLRSILDETIDCERLTVLVGRNGTGKSAFLHALDLFYDPKASAAPEDFYDEDMEREIQIAVTFEDLDQEAKKLFSLYLDGEELTVGRVFSGGSKKSGTYHGMKLQNPDFVSIRTAGGKAGVREQYNELRSSNSVYSDLPTTKSADQVEEELRNWEIANPSSCKRLRDDGQFFGFTGVGHGYLGRHTRFILIHLREGATRFPLPASSRPFRGRRLGRPGQSRSRR